MTSSAQPAQYTSTVAIKMCINTSAAIHSAAIVARRIEGSRAAFTMAASARKNNGAATWKGYRPVSKTPRTPNPANTETATDKMPVSEATRRSAPNDRAHDATAIGSSMNDSSTATLMAPMVDSWPKEATRIAAMTTVKPGGLIRNAS